GGPWPACNRPRSGRKRLAPLQTERSLCIVLVRKPAMPTSCPIVELRQYTLYPGRRAALVALFDRELVETQEAVGMRVIGQFCDLNDPHRFVWFRGFADMPARKQALTDFYTGPVWKAHRDAANA